MQVPKPGKRTIKMGAGNTRGILTPLVPFNCIYDTDIGLIRLIKTEYRDASTFNLNLLDSFSTDKELVKHLRHRKDFNPLIEFMNNKEDIETADDLYKQFRDKQYDQMIRYSVKTGIHRLVSLFPVANEINGTICYYNDIEKSILDRDYAFIKIRKKHIDKVRQDIHKYPIGQYYFKSVGDFYFSKLAEYIVSNSIFIMDYDYNFLDDMSNFKVTKEIALVEYNRCLINVISAFNDKELE